MLGEFESEEAGCHWELNPGYMACAASTSLIPRPLVRYIAEGLGTRLSQHVLYH